MIRHYEQIGLIPAAARRDSSDVDVSRLVFIANARDLGFAMEEIATLLSLWSDKNRASAEVKKLAIARAEELRRKAEALAAMRKSLMDLATCCQGNDRPDCPILEELSTGRACHDKTTGE
jgi:DNA-binding transcriptional MerR regulator